MKPKMRRSLADRSFEEKIRKVGELIRLSRKIKTQRVRENESSNPHSEIRNEFGSMCGRIFLSRRSLGEGGCSMRITEDVRKYAAGKGIDERTAIETGMREKAEEFQHAGAEIYAKP